MKNFRKFLVFLVFFPPLNLLAGEVNFSGFATFAGGAVLSESLQNSNAALRPAGGDRTEGDRASEIDAASSLAGYDREPGFNSGSLIGLQATSDLGENWEVTTQFVARGSETFNLNAEWAFLGYDATDNWRLLFGRQRVPFYMYSDFLDVSYAYHWIKPPSGVYSLPFDVFDGVGSIYKSTMGDLDSTLHVTFGRLREPVIDQGAERAADFSKLYSISWTVGEDWWNIRATYSRTKLSIATTDLNDVFGAWRREGYGNIANDLEMKDDTGDFSGLGFMIDYDDYLLVGEITKIRAGDNIFPDQESYYISFGRHFDDVLLHVTYGRDKNKVDFGLLDQLPAGFAAGMAPPGPNGPIPLGPENPPLKDVTKGIMSSFQEDSSYYTLGLRWEVSDSVAFKAEYTDFEDKNPATGRSVSLFQTALTTVF
ncbi:MAG: porin [Gammaproteobacteria bacterium]|nr:porin [Gammaproteobacteria bacterium]